MLVNKLLECFPTTISDDILYVLKYDSETKVLMKFLEVYQYTLSVNSSIHLEALPLITKMFLESPKLKDVCLSILCDAAEFRICEFSKLKILPQIIVQSFTIEPNFMNLLVKNEKVLRNLRKNKKIFSELVPGTNIQLFDYIWDMEITWYKNLSKFNDQVCKLFYIMFVLCKRKNKSKVTEIVPFILPDILSSATTEMRFEFLSCSYLTLLVTTMLKRFPSEMSPCMEKLQYIVYNTDYARSIDYYLLMEVGSEISTMLELRKWKTENYKKFPKFIKDIVKSILSLTLKIPGTSIPIYPESYIWKLPKDILYIIIQFVVEHYQEEGMVKKRINNLDVRTSFQPWCSVAFEMSWIEMENVKRLVKKRKL